MGGRAEIGLNAHHHSCVRGGAVGRCVKVSRQQGDHRYSPGSYLHSELRPHDHQEEKPGGARLDECEGLAQRLKGASLGHDAAESGQERKDPQWFSGSRQSGPISLHTDSDAVQIRTYLGELF